MDESDKKGKNTRIPVTWTPEMREETIKIAERRGAPLSSVIRGWIRAGLEAEGIELTDSVQWGRYSNGHQDGGQVQQEGDDQIKESDLVAAAG